MTITFNCEHCQKEVKAPDEAAGKRGKCPFCGQSMEVPNPQPQPAEDEDIIPMAPLDEEEERQRQREIDELLKQEHDLIAQSGGGPEVPIEQKENLSSVDLHHFVVNYCLDMASGKLDRAKVQAASLKKYGITGIRAVEDFTSGKATEQALASIQPKVLKGFLAQLRGEITRY